MMRALIGRLSSVAPIVMSLLAVGLVLFVVSIGWERDLKDKGMAAHVFQLLIAAQIPFILAFLMTADRTRKKVNSIWTAMQVAAMALAIGMVGYFDP